jgi:hypothetical protein
MAVITLSTRGDVGRVLAGRYRAIVAGITSTQDLCVIDGIGWIPDNIVVAIFTNVGGLDVKWILAGGPDAVVACGAASDDIGVIEVGRQPRYCGVAVVTVVAAGDVGRVFSGCDNAIVAGTAGTQYLRVIDPVGGRPQVAVVAVLAHIGGLNMGRILAGGFDAVVTARAVGHDVGVIESGWKPPSSRMAVITIIAASEVCRIFARGDRAIVAGTASANDLGVVDNNNGLPQ